MIVVALLSYKIRHPLHQQDRAGAMSVKVEQEGFSSRS